MEKFQDIYNDKKNQHFEKIVFLSDTPVFGVVKENNTEIRGGLFNTKELLGLMKSSIPAEALKGISWGKKVEYKDQGFEFLVELTVDKQVRVEIVNIKQELSQEEPKVEQKKEVEEIDPKIIDDLLSAQALVYYTGEQEPKELTEIISNTGFSMKSSNYSEAVKQTINYKAFPFLILFIGENLEEDPVLKELKSMHMDARRNQFTLLVSPASNIKTGDSELAFSYSVSMVLNSKDLAEFENLYAKTSDGLKRANAAFIDIIENKA